MERTLSIIKPDAVKRGLIGEVVKRIEQLLVGEHSESEFWSFAPRAKAGRK